MMSGRSSRYPFTPSQWQELEHQALIYKYMASGIPIPSDLILPIRRSYLLDSTMTSPSLGFPPQPSSLGWSCFQMGFNRKAEDPEPGRCRRTDGKKWRCSKEAYPDSKYCEKHMHRGKNRSRKPVEMPNSSTPNSNPNPNPNPNLTPSSSSSSSSRTPSPYPSSLSISTPHPYSLYANQLNNPSYYSTDRDYRYPHGMKEVEESHWQFTPLGMSSFGETKHCSAINQGSYMHCHNNSTTTTDLFSKEDEVKQQQHCFLLGADLKLDKPVRDQQEAEKPLRHFFDEWPQKSKDPWMDLEEAYSKTQLSISIPMAHHDFNDE